MSDIFQVKDLSFTYAMGKSPALRGLSFSVETGDIVLICGQSGSGKSTLLSHLKKSMIPHGVSEGKVLFQGEDILELSPEKAASMVGYVSQYPEEQIVTDKVWHELAFGLENLGVPSQEIRGRIAEIAEYFDMGSWFRRSVSELSGGQKQLLNLAAVMVMNPEVLLLDEPTAQMDPNSTRSFFDLIKNLHEDFGTTIILCEQRMEQAMALADKVMFLQDGELLEYGPVEDVLALLHKGRQKNGEALAFEPGLPPGIRLALELGETKKPSATKPALGIGKTPVTVGQGRVWITKHLDLFSVESGKKTCKEIDKKTFQQIPEKTLIESSKKTKNKEFALSAKGISFAYPGGNKVLEDFAIQVPEGSIFALLGGNGSGKTTALKVLAGICKKAKGKVETKKRVLYLPQEARSVFTEITLEDELAVMVTEGDIQEKVEQMLTFLELEEFKGANPIDLSGGQRQRLALGKLLLRDPEVLLLDEPTKGLDGEFKAKLGDFLKELVSQKKTILIVSHDMEFCAEYATHCGFLFDKRIISQGESHSFFCENRFYTTAVRRMTWGILQDCVTYSDLQNHLKEEGIPGKDGAS